MFLVIWHDALWSMFPNIFFFVIDYNWVQATLTCVPISLDFVLENLVILLYPEISSSSFLFFFISVLLGYVQWRSGFKEHCTWTPWWSDSLPPNETLLLFCLWFPKRFLTQQTWFRNCISWEKKFVESWIWIKSPTIMDINFFRLFDTLTNFPFTTSETKSDYY